MEQVVLEILNYINGIGDKIAITGKYNDGTARIYVVGGGVLANYKVKYFAMEQINSVWQFKQTPDELNTTISAASSNFHQFNPGPDGGFYFRSVGLNNFQQIKSDLTANIGNTHPTAIAAGSTVPVYIKSAGNYDFACYLRYGSATFAKQSTNQIEVVKIDRTLGVTSAVVVAVSPSFGKLAPGNGAGHVVVKNLPNGDADIYALSTQNGVARFTLTSDIINGIKNTPSTEIKFTKQNGRIIIDSNEVVSIELFNTIGQSVRSVKNSNTVITNNLKGIYILKVKVAGNVVRTEKINL
jgi:hypothetical protein